MPKLTKKAICLIRTDSQTIVRMDGPTLIIEKPRYKKGLLVLKCAGSLCADTGRKVGKLKCSKGS